MSYFVKVISILSCPELYCPLLQIVGDIIVLIVIYSPKANVYNIL